MASANGRKGPGLSEQLLREAYRFDFFQAVRVLERALNEPAGSDPRLRRQPVGHDNVPEREVVHFRAMPGLSFPAGSIYQLRPPRPGENGKGSPAEMAVAFLGLTGPAGVLPHHYTTLLLRRLRAKDNSLRDFLDLFNHRLVSLFFRAWEKYRLPASYERARLDPERTEPDPTTWALYCLVGLGTGGLRGRLSVDDEAFLFYSGHFSHSPRSAIALESMLEDYFGQPIKVEQLQGQWLYLGEGDCAQMPSPELPQGANCRMGMNVVVGQRVWDVQSKFRIRVGPLTYAEFRRFMPDGDGLRPLCEMVRAYVGPEFDFDVQPTLRPEEVPWSRARSTGAGRSRLGWNTWVRRPPFTREVAEPVFRLDDV
jgi:type VI secretion system protein ImpH